MATTAAIRSGMRVRIWKLEELDKEKLSYAPEIYIESRKQGAVGWFRGPVSGGGGTLFWVQYQDGDIAVHLLSELAPAQAL